MGDRERAKINNRQRMKKITLLIAMLMATSAWSESTITPEDLPPWLNPELLVHISAMKMNESQIKEFREGIKECVSGLQSVVKREIRKGGVNIPKRIKRSINRQYGEFDKRMKASLTESQLEPWGSYLEGLKVVMAERAMKR